MNDACKPRVELDLVVSKFQTLGGARAEVQNDLAVFNVRPWHL